MSVGGVALVVALSPTIFDRDGAPLDPSEFAQSLSKGGNCLALGLKACPSQGTRFPFDPFPLGSCPLQCREEYHALIGRSVTDFTAVPRRKGLLLFCGAKRCNCAGFWTPECGDYPRVLTAGVRKAPRQEIAVGSAPVVRRALWGFSRGAGLEEVGQKRLPRPVCCKPRMSASG